MGTRIVMQHDDAISEFTLFVLDHGVQLLKCLK
jgi:hypothetical protein